MFLVMRRTCSSTPSEAPLRANELRVVWEVAFPDVITFGRSCCGLSCRGADSVGRDSQCSSRKWELLLVAQRNQWIYSHRAACWNVTSNQRNSEQQDRYGCEGRGVNGGYSEKQRSHQPR